MKTTITTADLIQQINQELKNLNVKVRLTQSKNSLCLQYSVSPGKRKKISPQQIGLTTTGIYRAKEVAITIDNALRMGTYSQRWLDTIVYKIAPPEPIRVLVSDVTDRYPTEWHRQRKGQSTKRQLAATLTDYLRTFNRALRRSSTPLQAEYTTSLIDVLLATTDPNSDSRGRLIRVINSINKLLSLGYPLVKSVSVKSTVTRHPRSESEIIAIYDSFASIKPSPQPIYRNHPYTSVQCYQWLFGLIATYGLRTSEVFAIDWERSFKAETDYWLFLDETLVDGLKTGSRAIPPLPASWVALFDLATPKYPPVVSGKLSKQAQAIARYFRVHGIGCNGTTNQPYDFRHSYGIRSEIYLTPIVAAEAMGHSLDMHTQTYHHHKTDAQRIETVRAIYKQRGIV